MNRLQTLLLAILLTLALPAWGLDIEAQAAKSEGMRDYNLGFLIDALPNLEIAASAGDVEAMYTLGESHRLIHMGLTQEALDWYLQAAEHGDPHAMLRLYQGGACKLGDYCPADAEGWREKALAEQLPKAEAGDAQAMMALYSIYATLDKKDEAIDWLEKSAEAGYPEAQDWLGSLTRDGLGFYFTVKGRLEAAEKWVRKAAEQGYVPAMNHLTDILYEQGDLAGTWEWSIRGSEKGFLSLRLRQGWCYLNPKERGDICGVKQDVIKGWAILYAVAEETNDSTAKGVMKDNRSLLTLEQRREAKALAEADWIGHGPPLSNFPPKFGF